MSENIGEVYYATECEVDEAHEFDMRQLRKEQLRADISPEEAAEEMELHELDEEWFYD